MRGRRVLAALAASCLLGAGLSACTDDADGRSAPGESDIDVNTPKLRQMKATTGMSDCVPGTGQAGAGELPELTLPCLGGGTSVDLSGLTGPMLINLWSSNCGPCRTEMPALEAFHQEYGDQVAVLGIDYGDTYPEAALALVEQTGATYPSVADPGGELATELRIAGLPQFVLLDEQGRIAGQVAGGLESEREVVELVETQLGVTL